MVVFVFIPDSLPCHDKSSKNKILNRSPEYSSIVIPLFTGKHEIFKFYHSVMANAVLYRK